MRSLFLIFLTAASAFATDSSAVLGKIGDIELTTLDVRESLAALDAEQQSALSRDSAALGQYVRALLIQRLVLSQAKDKEWDQKPEVIARLVRTREATLAESYIESASTPAADYPSDTEIREAYEANKEKLQIPKSYRLAQIYIKVPQPADQASEDAAKLKLNAVRKRLAEKDADFAVIARHSSEEAVSAANGGEIGWLAESQIQPEIREKMPELKLNSISDPLRLADGWHIVKVLDIREARTPVLTEIRDELVTNLRTMKKRINRQKFVAELLEKHPVAINEIELMKTAAPNER
jgi:parvulin-like peptidyl-prolyl isomerase